MTRLDAYLDFVEQLEEAVSSLDQAWSSARDAGLDDAVSLHKPIVWESGHVTRLREPLNIEQLTAAAEALLRTMRGEECSECGKPIAEHDNGRHAGENGTMKRRVPCQHFAELVGYAARRAS